MDLIGVICMLLFMCVCFAEEYAKRKIQIGDPGIKCGNDSVPLIHATATKKRNNHDVIHYIVSTRNRPTILIKHVMKPTQLTFNEANICNETGKAFVFTEDKHETTSDISGLIISKVFAYTDLHDDVSLHAGYIEEDVMKGNNYSWSYKNSGSNEVIFEGTHDDATLRFTLKVHDKHGHGAKQPKNPVNANLTEFWFEMINLPINQSVNKYKQIRYGAEVIFFTTSQSSKAEAKHTTTQYIDDEYTPGIFEIWAIKFLQGLSKTYQTYVTWKPVSYHSNQYKRSDQGFVKKFMWKDNAFVKKLSNPLPNYKGVVPWSLIAAMDTKYYGINVTFGVEKDGFYYGHRYLSWSGMVGSGTPPVDTMSTELIVTIAIGLGTPGIVIFAGVIFFLVKKSHVSIEASYNEIQ